MPTADQAAEALLHRVDAALSAVQGWEIPSLQPRSDLYDTVARIVDWARDRGDTAASWLMIVALTGAMPDQALVRSVARNLALTATDEAVPWLLEELTPMARTGGNAQATLRLITDRPVVDVSYTSQADFLTGIQRVVRGVVAAWHGAHDLELVAWSGGEGAYRALRPRELKRLLSPEATRFHANPSLTSVSTKEIVVPWGVPVVVTEVPSRVSSSRLAALAELTTNSVRLVGYDCIPMASGELVPLGEPEKFGRYLELVKHSDRLAAISRTAADEFTGFDQALKAQGLTGPQITPCALPHTADIGSTQERIDGAARPRVVCVGSVGRRKNQAALVEAAEMLWREGLDFEVRIVGLVGPETTALSDLLPELRQIGRPIRIESAVSDARVAELLSTARCLVLPSLHEGFGLPVVEALTQGVPVITSNFGSLREVAENQGGLLVDPLDVPALTDALRTLLTDASIHEGLVRLARNRPPRTWTDYAEALWGCLVA